VSFAEVEQFINTPVKHYSTGMYLRLAFAVAAHLDPEILLVDEVLAVGDTMFQNKCLRKMNDVALEGRTVLFVSHNLGSISKLCRQGILLENGLLTQKGPIDVIVERYLESIIPLDQCSQGLLQQRNGRRLWLTHAELLDKNRNPTKVVTTGQDLIIALQYETVYQSALTDVIVRVSFSDIHRNPLFVCNSLQSKVEKFQMPPSGTLLATVPKLPLIPGEYIIEFTCLVDRVPIANYENLLRIHVDEGDFFGSGRLPNRKRGCFLVNHCWNVIPARGLEDDNPPL